MVGWFGFTDLSFRDSKAFGDKRKAKYHQAFFADDNFKKDKCGMTSD
jgi:hypothetical protein